MIKHLVKIVFVIFVHLTAYAQSDEITFTASGKEIVSEGEQFRVVYTLNASGKNFKGPSFKGFRVLSGPNPSTSSNIQIINGKYTSTVTNSYTYYLTALKEGEYTIGPATIEADGKTYASNSLEIKVVKGTPPADSRNSKEQRGEPQQGVKPEDVFLRTIINNNNPYLGEQLVVTYKIYTRVPIPQYSLRKFPSFNGFWAQDLMDENEQPQQRTEVVNGVQYMTAEIKKVALFPLKSAELTIDPIELDVVLQVRSSQRRNTGDPFFDRFFDDSFFGFGYRNIERTLVSKPVELNVKPLPLENRPADFKGAVGQFSLKSNIDKTNVKTNEAINLKFTIWGRGNVKLIDDLGIAFPPDFEVYDPKINNKINTSGGSITGIRTIEYLLIPRNPGDFMIKPVTFSYFDPEKEKYSTLKTDEFVINVEKGEEGQSDAVYGIPSQEEIQYIGSDIRYIKTSPFELRIKGRFFFGSGNYFIILGVALLAAIVFIIVWNQIQRKRRDKLLMKTRRATRTARKRLKKAGEYLKGNNETEFYNEVSQALWGYLADKFNIPVSDLSIDKVGETLKNKKIDNRIIDHFTETLNNCEFARFAPGSQTENMNRIFDEAMNAITRTEKELK